MFAASKTNAVASATDIAYIEDVFSTWLYSGTGSATNTITNNINLSTKDGMVWIKSRTDVTNNKLTDTVRGVTKALSSNLNTGQVTDTTGLKTFSTTGFAVGANSSYNSGSFIYASWTFRKQPKFFDVVTYTGTGANRTISHSLGSVPACIIVKRTDTTADWQVYHMSLANTEYLVLNNQNAKATGATRWNSTTPTSTVFSLGTDATVNASGGTYVAYVFAHNAGGFGLTGTDNVISCGSYTGNGSATGPVVTLGYEPQWLMIKKSSDVGDWQIIDNMRGMPVGSADATLQASLSNFETSVEYVSPTSTGFQITSTNTEVNTSAATYIYIAIRRGPMKVPTSGTSVFSPVAYSGTGTTNPISTGFVNDSALIGSRQLEDKFVFGSRLQGNRYMLTSYTVAEATSPAAFITNPWASMTSFSVSNSLQANASGNTYIGYGLRRAPSFFDEVCYTGTGSNGTITHNLGAVPELIIVKRRNTTGAWDTYCSALANTEYIVLNTTAAKATGATRWNSTTPTSSVFSVGTSATTNASGGTYVAYLFATCSAVSKVGSYTGTGTTKQVDCGFTGSARFVLIKRTDSTGDWYVWDSARGIIAGNDPYLLLNSTAADVTGTDYIDTYSAGFEISSTAPAAINANGGTFIFLAIA